VSIGFVCAYSILLYLVSFLVIDVGGTKLPWDLTSTNDGGPGFPYLSMRFMLVITVAISVFDFVGDILYFVVIALEGDGAYCGFQTFSLFIFSILALTMPSVLYALFMGFPSALCLGWVQTAQAFPAFYLRYTFGVDTFEELWTSANAITPPRASHSSASHSMYLFRLVELSAGNQDWCSSLERAIMHLVCLLIFLGSSMLFLAATCMLIVPTLLILWPTAVIICLTLGMNLKLFLFAPYSAWVTSRLMRVTPTQGRLNVYQTNMSLIIEQLFEAIPEIAIILLNESLRGEGLSASARFALATSALVLLRSFWPIAYNVLKHTLPWHRASSGATFFEGVRQGLSVPIIPTTSEERKAKYSRRSVESQDMGTKSPDVVVQVAVGLELPNNRANAHSGGGECIPMGTPV